MGLVADLDVGEGQSAQIHRQADRAIERRHLRRMPHDVLAPARAAPRRAQASSAMISGSGSRSFGLARGRGWCAAARRPHSRCRGGHRRSPVARGAAVDAGRPGWHERRARRSTGMRNVGQREPAPPRVAGGRHVRRPAVLLGCCVGVDGSARRRRRLGHPAADAARRRAAVRRRARRETRSRPARWAIPAGSASRPPAGGSANQTVWQRTQRTDRPVAPIAAAST